MTRAKNQPGRTARRAALALAAALLLPLAACSTDEIVEVTDPDIINPGDISSPAGAEAVRVSSPAGAEAVRVGTLSRFMGATTGDNGASAGETLFMYGGLLADEWQTGDSFIQRVETDQRTVSESNTLIRGGYQFAHRARVSAQQALALLREFAPTTPTHQLAEMYFVQAYIENLLAESFCSGVPFSSYIAGEETLGTPLTSVQSYERALAHADSGLATVTGTTTAANRVRNALRVVRGRILLNLNRPADAAAAVAEVPAGFSYVNQHSQTTRDVTMWAMNNSARRYTVAQSEGGNGLPFHNSGDPRLPICTPRPTISQVCRDAGVTSGVVFNNGSPTPLFVQLKWPTRDANVSVADATEARLIEAEALLRAGDAPGALGKLNALRAGVTGLAPLPLAATAAGQVDQLFRERAFWLFGTGHRLGDLRRLIRQYGRTQQTVFPVGTFAEGGNYGTDVNLPIPQAERNNPNFQGCLDRNA